MTNSKTPKLSDFAISTLGTWAHGDAIIRASYHDDTTIRIDVAGESRVLTPLGQSRRLHARLVQLLCSVTRANGRPRLEIDLPVVLL